MGDIVNLDKGKTEFLELASALYDEGMFCLIYAQEESIGYIPKGLTEAELLTMVRAILPTIEAMAFYELLDLDTEEEEEY
jgi:hypothetical protein